MVSYEKIKEHKEIRIEELKYSKKYNDFLDDIERELYKQIDDNPFLTFIYIKVPSDIDIGLIIKRLTEDHGYKVSEKERERTIIISL